MSCVRNLFYYKNKLTTKIKIVLIIISTILSLILNTQGLIGVLPLITSVVYILFIDVEDVVTLKLAFLFASLLWSIYDFYTGSYTSAAFDLGNFVTNIIAIVQIKKNEKMQKNK